MIKLLPSLIVFLLWIHLAYAQEPTITIHTSLPGTAPGSLFFAPFSRNGFEAHLMILSEDDTFYYKQPAGPLSMLDFKVMEGRPVVFNQNTAQYEFMDWAFGVVATATAIGYPTDHHDIQPVPEGDGRYLLMIYHEFEHDMSPFGGSPTATVVSLVLQEVDLQGNVHFEWDSWDHIPITDSNRPLQTPRIDYIHGNAVEYDHDGHILISSRNLDEITKINRQSGAVIWRLGGKANQFTFTNDAGFALQHDIRRLPNGHITLFDNGEASRGYSRAVEYEIDEVNKVITRTWEYQGPFAGCCGNAQRLANGNTLINWGSAGQMTEVKADGTKVFEATIDGATFTYRAFRFPVGRIFYLPAMFKLSQWSE
jgi:hypothetical protein